MRRGDEKSWKGDSGIKKGNETKTKIMTREKTESVEREISR